MRRNTTHRTTRALVTATLALAAVGGCSSETGKAGRTVDVLKWRRDLHAGQTVVATDVSPVAVPADSLPAAGGLAHADPSRLSGARLARDVRRGNLVLRADLARPARTASRPADKAGDPAGPWRDLPVARDPTTMEAGGVVERYLTTTRSADAAQLADYADPTDRPVSPSILTTQPLIEIGLEKLTGAVAGEMAPPGAKRAYAFRQIVPGGWVDYVGYWTKSDVASVEKFYTDRMPRTGYRLAARGKTARRPDGVSLTFVKDVEHHCFVRLHPVDTIQDAGGGTVKIVLILRRPRRDPAR